MKKIIFLIFVIFIFNSCVRPQNDINEQKVECDLKPDSLPNVWEFSDRTFYNVSEYIKDENGVDWETKTNNEYRFVISDNLNDSNKTLLVYKNKNLFHKYANLKCVGNKYVPVNKKECEYDVFRERRTLEYFFIEKDTGVIRMGEDIVDQLSRTLGFKSTVVEILTDVEHCSCTIEYFMDSRTRIIGTSKREPYNGQKCL